MMTGRFYLRGLGPGQSVGQALAVFLFLVIFLVAGWLLVTLKFIFLPMFLALFATFLLSPAVEWLCRRGLPRPLAIAVTLALALALGYLAVSYVYASLSAFYRGFPKYEERLQLLAAHAKEISGQFSFLTYENVRQAISALSLTRLVGGALNSVITIISYAGLTLLFILYFLPAFPKFGDKIRRAFPGQRGHLFCRALSGIGGQVQSYIVAKTLTSLITGLGVAAACLAFGVDFAVTWGVFAALLNFIPTIGACLSFIPPVAVAALQPDLGGLATALWLAATLGAVMVLTGNVLEPRVLGHSVNLSPTASLLALFLWGWLWGAVGMLIAVPAMAMIKFTCDNVEKLKPLGTLLGN